MGLSWSKRRDHTNNLHQNQPPSQLLSSYPSSSSSLPPPPPLPPPPNYYYPPNPPYNMSQSYPQQYHSTLTTHIPPPLHNPYYYQFSPGYTSNWRPEVRPPAVPQAPPPPFVDHQKAKTIRNDVNIHKETIKIEADENDPNYSLVSFIFDALVDGSITIFYFAKEGSNCKFTPVFPEAYTPVEVPFQKGVRQKFCQPSGTGIDLGFFETDDLSNPSPSEDIFPLVIFAEAYQMSQPIIELADRPPPTTSSAQITEAVLEKNIEGAFQVKVIKQILWVDEVRYELREIYGIGNSVEAGFDDNDPGQDCVICMSEPKNTAVLPCRHMCMCSECAKELRLQTNNCPICRQPIEKLIEIKVNGGDS